MVDHGTILDDDPVLTALQVDRHFLNRCHHDTYLDLLEPPEIENRFLDLFDPVLLDFLLLVSPDVFTTVLAAPNCRTRAGHTRQFPPVS